MVPDEIVFIWVMKEVYFVSTDVYDSTSGYS